MTYVVTPSAAHGYYAVKDETGRVIGQYRSEKAAKAAAAMLGNSFGTKGTAAMRAAFQYGVARRAFPKAGES